MSDLQCYSLKIKSISFNLSALYWRGFKGVIVQINLSGKKALVTGSTSGIGLAIATQLSQAGAAIVLVSRDQDKLAQAIELINQASGRSDVVGVVADLGTAEGCKALIEQQPEVDILVNNLGIYGPCPFFEITDEAWEEIYQVNVLSGMRLSRHYAQGMRAKGWGRIQFISSESALNIPENMVHYGVSKAALQGLSRGLAKVLSGTNVTVNTILPGPTLTEGSKERMAQRAAQRGVTVEEMEVLFLQENRPSSIIKRFARPEEVANLCVYMASPQSSATTGAALKVEGGIVESIT